MLLIVTHNLITRLISNCLTRSFCACISMVNLNNHICKFMRSAFKSLTTYSNEGFTFFASQYWPLMTMKCKEKENLTSCYIQNCAYIMLKAFIISKSKKHQSNSLMDILATTKHWLFTCMMDISRTSLHISWLTPTSGLKMLILVINC